MLGIFAQALSAFIMKGVTPGLATGASTDAISGEHLILTAAGIIVRITSKITAFYMSINF
ncbi:MAG: hypothetical protein HDS13_06915 [Bacteroides sp.]|nr:hypothetical protein [Bacteroides sp.]